jgi:hypothetical protein
MMFWQAGGAGVARAGVGGAAVRGPGGGLVPRAQGGPPPGRPGQPGRLLLQLQLPGREAQGELATGASHRGFIIIIIIIMWGCTAFVCRTKSLRGRPGRAAQGKGALAGGHALAKKRVSRHTSIGLMGGGLMGTWWHLFSPRRAHVLTCSGHLPSQQGRLTLVLHNDTISPRVSTEGLQSCLLVEVTVPPSPSSSLTLTIIARGPSAKAGMTLATAEVQETEPGSVCELTVVGLPGEVRCGALSEVDGGGSGPCGGSLDFTSWCGWWVGQGVLR